MSKTNSQCTDDCARLKWVFRLLVVAQFLLVAALVLDSRSVPTPWYSWAASMAACAFGLWAIVSMGRFINISPALKDNAPLRTNGPYRIVRHPMYAALLIFASGYLMKNFSAHTIALWLALLFVLSCKIYYEERILRRRFAEYDAYSQNVKRVIPFLY